MLTKITTICVAAAVGFGGILAVPAASFAQDKDKSATATSDKPKAAKPKAAAHHKKPKKGHADTVHENSGNRP
jgi:hypothetical protein